MKKDEGAYKRDLYEWQQQRQAYQHDRWEEVTWQCAATRNKNSDIFHSGIQEYYNLNNF